jgi:monofunctional glycosyltransferase
MRNVYPRRQAARKKASVHVVTMAKYLTIAFIIQFAYVLFCRFVDPPITLTQWQSQGESSRDYRSQKVPLAKISRNLLLATIAAEDSGYLHHGGIEWQNMLDTVLQGKGGGSTISQQTAKNVFLWQNQDIVRKILEVGFTYEIEAIWGKRRILETYLNVIEFERGVYGIEAASRKFFNKSAANLTRQESATIISCLPHPKECLSQRNNWPKKWLDRRQNILEGMDNLEHRLGTKVDLWF